MSDAQVVLAHLSDTHLDGSTQTRARVRAVASALSMSVRPVDAILVTGDLTEPGPHTRDELAFLEDTLRPLAPVVYVPGNSDERQGLRDFLGLPTDPAPIHRVLTVGSLQLIMVDTSVPGQMLGHVGADALEFVERGLSSVPTDGRALLVMHHPPRTLGHDFVDSVRAFGETAGLESFVRKDPRLIGTLLGHTHAATFARFGGKPMMVATGVHSAGQLPGEFEGDLTKVIDVSAPPGFMVHYIDGDDIVTYSRTVAAPAD